MTTVRLTFRMAADSSRKGTLYFQIIHRNTYGAQNEVYNDDWVKSGLIVLCFS